MVDYAWLFFRAGSLSVAVDMTKRILTDFRFYTLSGDWIEALSLPEASLRSIPPALLITAAVDILHEKGISIISRLSEQGIVFRWICYMGSILIVMLAAVQNLGQSTGEFIYFRF